MGVEDIQTDRLLWAVMAGNGVTDCEVGGVGEGWVLATVRG